MVLGATAVVSYLSRHDLRQLALFSRLQVRAKSVESGIRASPISDPFQEPCDLRTCFIAGFMGEGAARYRNKYKPAFNR